MLHEQREIAVQTIASPVGNLILVASESALLRLCFQQSRDINRIDPRWRHGSNAITDSTATQLREYFAGIRTRFEVPCDACGTTFQQRVWSSLCGIPYGQTRSYLQIAKDIDAPRAIRAVGAANGANPIPIVIPCHRVIGSNGMLTGFGGGLPTKKYLLTLEQSRSVDVGQLRFF